MAASVGVACGAYGAGALPSGDPGSGMLLMTLDTMPVTFRWGVSCYLVSLAIWSAVWWRLGAELDDHDGRPGQSRIGVTWWGRTGALWALPLLLAPVLGSRDPYSYVCQGWLYAEGIDPYTVGSASGQCPWLGAVASLWKDTTTPYGPLGVALSGVASTIASAIPLPTGARLTLAIVLLRLIALLGMALVLWGGARVAQVCQVPPARAAWLGAVTPLTMVHAVSGAHNDAVMAGLVLAGLAMIAPRPSTERAAWAAAIASGGILGLAVAVKVTAIVVVPFAVLLAVGTSPTRVVRAVVGVGGAAVATFTALTGMTGLGLGWVGALGDTAALAQWTSIPSAVGMSADYLLRGLGHPEWGESVIAGARLAGLVLLVAAAIGLWTVAARRRENPRAVLVCCGATLTAVAALSPVFYPWYALTPIAVLGACVRAAAVRRWLAIAVIGVVFLVLPNGLGLAGLTKGPGAFVITVGIIAGGVFLVARRREFCSALGHGNSG